MSYIKKVLADRPLGFWSLDTTSDLTGGGNSLVFNSAPTHTDILPLNTSTYKDLDTNEYVEVKGFYVDLDTDAYINNEYNAFVKGTEELSFGIELWFSIPPSNTDTVQSLLAIGNSSISANIGDIYRVNDVISFNIYSGNIIVGTASKQIKSTESQLHVFASYFNRTISISINGMAGESFTLPSTFQFETNFADKNNIHFSFVSPYNPIILSSLAFYNYTLSQNQIRSHMIWGFGDAKPQSYVKQTAGDLFDIQENPSMKWYEKTFDTDRSFKDGTINNLYTIDNGLTHRRSSAVYVAPMGFNYAFDDLLNYISLNNFSMSTTVNWDALPVYLDDPTEYSMILKITGNDDSEFVYLAKTEDGSLGLYYTYANNPDVLLLQTKAASGTTPIFFSVKNNFVNIYIDSGGSAYGNVFPNFSATTTKLYLNNIAYMTEDLDIFNFYIDSNSYYEAIVSYEDNLVLSFINDVVKTKGTWNYSVPASLFYGIAGSKLSWNTATATNNQYLLSSYIQSVCVQVKTDPNGDWHIIKNGGQIPAFVGTGSPAFDIKIKITILSNDASSLYQPRIDNFNISIYKSIDVLSDSKNYIIKPYYEEGSSLLHTYNLRSNNFNVLSRSNNFGIKIDNGNTAIMMPTIPTTGFQTLEFWFRPDGINEDSQDQYIVNNNVTGEYLKFDKDTLELSQDLGTPFLWIYVNGLDLATNPRTLIIDEPYHIICIYFENNINNVFINSDTNIENYAIGTYGYFAIYPNQLSADDAKDRYISYLTSFTEIVNESNTIGTIAEYSGISTDYNAGSAIHSYQNASTRP